MMENAAITPAITNTSTTATTSSTTRTNTPDKIRDGLWDAFMTSIQHVLLWRLLGDLRLEFANPTLVSNLKYGSFLLK